MPAPLRPPLTPMLAKPVASIPAGMAYEPKWDGFRALVFRENDDVQVWSRHGKELTIYFPELVVSLLENVPPRCVLDGEIVIVAGHRLDFVRLTERIHPAASRIKRLSEEMPASFVAFDLLAVDSTDLTGEPYRKRRRMLETALAHADAPIHLSPVTTDEAEAERWFAEFEGAGLDGVVAKPLDGTYEFGARAMFKIKHKREADVVVAGYRLHKDSTPERPLLGSLQCGLYDAEGRLSWVGAAASFPMKTRELLAAELGALALPADSDGYARHPWGGAEGGARRPGGESRWAGALKETHLIEPFLVAQVGYEHMEGDRFRNNPRFQRWRPDREPESCTFEQLEVPAHYDFDELFQN